MSTADDDREHFQEEIRRLTNRETVLEERVLLLEQRNEDLHRQLLDAVDDREATRVHWAGWATALGAVTSLLEEERRRRAFRQDVHEGRTAACEQLRQMLFVWLHGKLGR